MNLRGDEIIRGDPFSYVVKSSILPNVCDFCLQTTFENSGKSFTVKKCTGKILAKNNKQFSKAAIFLFLHEFRVQKDLLL